MSRLVRLGIGVGAAACALLVGTASAVACPPGTVERWVCTNRPPACVIVCVPALDVVADIRH